MLKNVRDAETGPILVHVVTQKGKGYAPAESLGRQVPRRRHLRRGHRRAGQGQGATRRAYTKVFAESLIKEARKDDKIVAITAAMPSGTGLDLFGKEFPDRTFDVGIAEQHAVTFAAGLATEGYKPFCAIYSTFLQRAYDQVVHDVAIQKLPVRFALDRAGLVGADGPTHAGAFDVAYLGCLPGFVVMAAADEAELVHMVATAAAHDDGPIAFRYPRGEGVGVEMPEVGVPLAIGKGRIVREGGRVALLSLGTRLARMPEGRRGARGARALDHGRRRALRQAPRRGSRAAARPRPRGADHRSRKGAIGGFGSHVLQLLAERGALDQRPEGPRHGAARPLHRPGQAGAHVRRRPGSTRPGIVAKVFEALGREAKVLKARA